MKSQINLFEADETTTAAEQNAFEAVTFKYVESVLGSGYEEKVSELAIHDKVAHRAARKNMQIHSAVIAELDGEFIGFFTFQRNHKAREFCFLQSALWDDYQDKGLYRRMVEAVIEQNTDGYPALITVGRKSYLETPELFESLGFKTRIEKSGFCYMVLASDEDQDTMRAKTLVQIAQTNVWNSTKGEWLAGKREWNERIEAAGEKYGIPNPKFATREGCWQGENGFSQVVSGSNISFKTGKMSEGKALNGNASVLDPFACEVCARVFMPREGKRVYNPFGGGVQFGFVSGACGYEYVASEIRQNQCDANNAICQDFESVKWVQSDSSTYDPDGMFDMVFTCPPYYKVEKYVDYDGNPPEGEINAMSTYEEFRETLFKGYKKAIDHLNDNCFFIAMVGDSRDGHGAYYGMEAETELFLKEQGLHLYNKIIYLEAAFTRLAQMKKTIDNRKFPKQEQKIIVAYKGDMSKIKDLYEPFGRL